MRKSHTFQRWMSSSFEINESLKAIIVKEAPKYLRQHASEKDYVLRQLLGHNFSFLGEDGGKNHQPFCSW